MLHSGRPRSAQFLIQRGTHSCRLIERMWSDRAATGVQPRKDKAERFNVKRRAGGCGERTHTWGRLLLSLQQRLSVWGGLHLQPGEGYVQQATCRNHLKFQAETESAPRVSFHLHPARQTPLRRAGKKKKQRCGTFFRSFSLEVCQGEHAYRSEAAATAAILIKVANL